MKRRGDLTRHAILDHALSVASQVGLEGLTIGRLADDLELSKSGLFAHFGSKEALQSEVLGEAAIRFINFVVRPALQHPRGYPRLRALLENWLRWPQENRSPGGCLFVAAATELDDRPGPVRDFLVKLQRDWLDTLTTAFKIAIEEGHLRPDADPRQLAFELQGLLLMSHHASRLLGHTDADERARLGFDRLLRSVAGPNYPA